MTKTKRRAILVLPLAATVFGMAGCDRQMRWAPVDMWNRSRYKPLEPEPFFADGSSTRPPVPGTVARDGLKTDVLMYQGHKPGSAVAPLTVVGDSQSLEAGSRVGGGNGLDRAVGPNNLGNDRILATTFPFPITKEVLQRGETEFNIYCTPCHSRVGDGKGMIVERGFPAPPSFHIDRLRKAPVGHYFDVITHGYGAMYSYASRVEPRDRWAIIAYIRLLQARSKAKGMIDSAQMDTPRSPDANVPAGSVAPAPGAVPPADAATGAPPTAMNITSSANRISEAPAGKGTTR